ncbi:MAG: sodium-independent anion transporter, partial [Gammaproteobacteria bacterium]
MIGQSVINVKSGGRGRLSTFIAGLFLIIMVVFLDEWIGQIPMAALVAVMIMVSIGTFSWDSLRNLKKSPLSSNIVMTSTVVVVVVTHNLALGVFVGVLLAAMFFANKIGRYMAVKVDSGEHGQTDGQLEGQIEGERTYKVVGQVFFASSEQFVQSFDFKEVLERVTIDVSDAHFWDITAVAALDKVVLKFRREGAEVNLIGMNEASATIVDTFGVHDKPEKVEQMLNTH